jgi:hypothetical protein
LPECIQLRELSKCLAVALWRALRCPFLLARNPLQHMRLHAKSSPFQQPAQGLRSGRPSAFGRIAALFGRVPKGYSSWCQLPRLARFVSRGRIHAPAGLTYKQPMQEVSIASASCQWLPPPALPPFLAVRSVRASSSRRWPNPSVKGTSRKRSAPYVER